MSEAGPGRRSTGGGDQPVGPASLSVCVIQFTSRAHLIRCLDALVPQIGSGSEIIVPYDDGLADVPALRSRFPAVRFLAVPGRRTPAELRSAATRESSGEIIAFLEDHCVPASDWAARLVAAHASPYAAVGGAVDKGFPPGRSGDTALNWAIYLTDYSRYMNPQPAGPSHSLTDCNVSYKRSALEPIRDAWSLEFHENIVNGLLAERSEVLWLDPGVLVLEQRTVTLGDALGDRYAFGRLFASTRVAGLRPFQRLVYAAGSLAMPPVLVLRVARNVTDRRRNRLAMLRCLPQLFLVTGTWMVGESLGYLTGRPAARLDAAAASARASAPLTAGGANAS